MNSILISYYIHVQSALGLRKCVEVANEPCAAVSAAAPAADVCTVTHADRCPRPWVMPHQLPDRSEGVKTAKAINSRRNPSGGFANFDLAKAPK